MKRLPWLSLMLVAVIAAMWWLRRPAPVRAVTVDTPWFRIADVAGRDPAAVARALGAASACRDADDVRRCAYREDRVTVDFHDDRAQYIVVQVPAGWRFVPDSLRRIGLLPRPPDATLPNEFVWRDLAGLREIRMTSDGERLVRLSVAVGG